MNEKLGVRILPLLALVAVIVSGCATSVPINAPANTPQPSPPHSTIVVQGCSAPDAATMAAINSLAPTPEAGQTVQLVKTPYVVQADETREVVAFSYDIVGTPLDPINHPGPVKMYAVKIGSGADVSAWVDITGQPYNDDPANWPSWSQSDKTLFAAAHIAWGCLMGG